MGGNMKFRIAIIGRGVIATKLENVIIASNHTLFGRFSNDDIRIEEFRNRSDVITIICERVDTVRRLLRVHDFKGPVVDVSPAHRTDPNWTYCLPEMIANQQIKGLASFSIPGCFATGFLTGLLPLKHAGLLERGAVIRNVLALGGMSVLGSAGVERACELPRQYSVGRMHHHVPELVKYLDLYDFQLYPVITNSPSGMMTQVELQLPMVDVNHQLVKAYQHNDLIELMLDSPTHHITPFEMAHTAKLRIHTHNTMVNGQPRVILTTTFDNMEYGSIGHIMRVLNTLCS